MIVLSMKLITRMHGDAIFEDEDPVFIQLAKAR